ncbi:energy-coupling factor ABC transporter ATP-binding protein [Paenibacillus spiritus]|uniref:Energy-coupling factor ABC transporter ATP-binding protein n=1 Tax=Paenibacillus spiritus TaxID=2496557 RepID=A0A5J5G5Q2_9BACL|nr:ABC transporter ATP-binding protein [Paenibacillus spiritus]KAA9002383.1 energy-coupling factor ABC transporter ATP-binding protein [Paenibacillus spiritus]
MRVNPAAQLPAAPYAAEICGVTFSYPGSDHSVLNGASLTVGHGSFTAIIGGNGCGKSTLCKLFNGLIPHYYSGEFSGDVRINGEDAADRSVAELSRMVGYVYQDFENQLVRPTVLDEACFAPMNYGLADYRERALRALDLCGLAGLEDRYIWELSGGQKHLLALAGALALEPGILIVDEPVSQLDPRHARQVYDVLRRIHTIHGRTVIVIEHHTEFIADYCQDVCLMEQGRVVWQLPVAEALNRLQDLERLGIQPPEVTRTAARLAALQPEAAGTAREPYPITVEEAAAYFSRLLPAGPPAAAGMQAALSVPNMPKTAAFPQSEPGSAAEPGAGFVSGSVKGLLTGPDASGPAQGEAAVIRLERVSLGYRSIRKQVQPVLHGVTLRIGEGERVALVGSNGAGKSSLMKLIAGIARPSSGAVEVLGQDTRTLTLERLSREVAYIFQNPEDMFIEDSVRKEIAYCLDSRGYAEPGKTVDHMLRSFRLGPLQERDARLLSGGQQRRVSLAIGSAVRPAVMLLDEPTANLDMATREELLGMLRELEQHVRTVIIATHDMQLVNEWATRVIVMHQGEITADGTAAEIFADSGLIGRAGLALTQSMELSAALGLYPVSSSPAALADRLRRMQIQEKEENGHAACPQLV